jgi:DNA-directed RNA polymerase specialized sigma24 family protein
VKHGGQWNRVQLEDVQATGSMSPDDLLALNEAIDTLASHDALAAELAKLRCFAGLSVEEAAEVLGLSRTSGYRQWTYAKAWLFSQLRDGPTAS